MTVVELLLCILVGLVIGRIMAPVADYLFPKPNWMCWTFHWRYGQGWRVYRTPPDRRA